MQGRILDYSVRNNEGVVSGENGSRYTFGGSEWKGDSPPNRGTLVDFDVRDNRAVAVYVALNNITNDKESNQKSRTKAGVLAIFLGYLGIHKFYLGYNGPGLFLLLMNTIGWILTIWLLGIPNFILATITFIEGIIYLTKSDTEFTDTYVRRRRSWF